jgi:hypothetical protein
LQERKVLAPALVLVPVLVLPRWAALLREQLQEERAAALVHDKQVEQEQLAVAERVDSTPAAAVAAELQRDRQQFQKAS